MPCTSCGYRFRKDYRLDLDGGRRVRPDIAFTARRVAVFVDGCFWHACPEHGSKPRANDWYWTPKLARNVERDRVADETLASAGWQVVRIWEHESLEQALAAVIAVVGARVIQPPGCLARRYGCLGCGPGRPGCLARRSGCSARRSDFPGR